VFLSGLLKRAVKRPVKNNHSFKMNNLMKIFVLSIAFATCGVAWSAPDTLLLEQGQALYEGAGSCVACHLEDGKGQPGSVPPLVNSDWLGDTNRTVAIVLRGLAGPIKVNAKRYYSAMPPQLLFDDEKIAKIVTYVNNAWGNTGPEVTEQQVSAARASFPEDVLTPEAVLKRFPFPKNKQKANGTYTPDFDDTLSVIDHPVVYRTFMPGASPAAFAVALPGNQYYCWDAGESRLRYIWTKGGFIRGNQVHWSSNGKPIASFNGSPYYRAQSSLLKPENDRELARTNHGTPFYDTSQAQDFPFVIAGAKGPPKYRGYRLINGYPEFRYQLGNHVIHEHIKATEDATGVVRRFRVEPPVELTFKVTLDPAAKITSSAGVVDHEGLLKLSAQQAREFQLTILEREPFIPVPVTNTQGEKTK
jgi:mono/diheme cytochrome c family protein